MTATAWCLAVLALLTAALTAWAAAPRRYPLYYRPRRRLTARHTPAAIAAADDTGDDQ
jgi:hypothetical protein